MPKQIIKPGLYDDFPATDYHNDPCPTPSLNSGLISTLIDECPARAWADHPKNPNYERKENDKFNLPNVCHALLLNAGRDYRIVDADDWRTKAAQEKRDAIIKDGCTPILPHQLEEAKLIAAEAKRQIDRSGYAAAWNDKDTQSEVTCAWQEGGIWCRSRLDRLYAGSAPGFNGTVTPGAMIIMDYKTTDAALNEWTISNYAVNQGWQVQSNYYKRGLSMIAKDSDAWKPPEFVYFVQSRNKPYPMMTVKLSRALDMIGERQIEHAIAEWGKGLAKGWVGWTDAMADLPSWYQAQWLQRELEDGNGAWPATEEAKS